MILNPDFLEAIKAVNNYVKTNEEKSFLEGLEEDHIFIQALKIGYYLGNNKISKEIAESLVKINSPFIVMCSNLDNWTLTSEEGINYPYTEVNKDDLINEEFDEEWGDFIIELKTK